MKSNAKTPTRAHILVIEESSVFREMQGLLLSQAGYAVSSHESPLAALGAAAAQPFDLAVIDYELSEMGGERVMQELRKLQPGVAVIFVSSSLTLELAIKLSRQSVAGFFNKPANPKALLAKINETLAGLAQTNIPSSDSRSPMSPVRRGQSESPFGAVEVTVAEPPLDRVAYPPEYFVGQSDVFRAFTHRAWKARDFRTVLLLQGPPGSPFELFVRDLVRISIFRDGPLMACDAAHFNATHLIEVLAPALLAHDAGTLLVTRVDMFTQHQQQTLHNLLGSRDVFLPFARRVRVVLASTRSLAEQVRCGAFDESLFRKLGELALTIPSLAEMRSDIVANALRILETERELGASRRPLVLNQEAKTWLEAQAWPGNYEQLSRVLTAASRVTNHPTITLAALQAGLHRPDAAIFALNAG